MAAFCIRTQPFRQWGGFKDTKSDRAAHAYRTLRLSMKQQEAHEEEAMFWALEQKSKRSSLGLSEPKNCLPWALSWSYDLLSEYGLNATRPLGWLMCWIAFFALFIYDEIDEKLVCGETLGLTDHWLITPGKTLVPKIWESCEKAFGFSVAQSARPFFIWGDNSISVPTKLLATLDSAISLTLVALFILAVRRRFRMQ